MSNARRNRVPRPSDVDVGGLIPPHEMFGRPLPRPFFVDAHLPFEERVKRAWEHIKATRFMPEEHERLRELLLNYLHGQREA